MLDVYINIRIHDCALYKCITVKIVQWPNVGYYSSVLVLTGKAGPYVDVSMTF